MLVGIEKVFWRSGCGKTPVRRERRFYGRPALPGPACSPEEQSHNVRAVSAICSFPSGRCPAAGRCSVRAVLSGWADAGCGDARRGPLFSAAGGCPAAAQMNGNGPAPDGSAVGGRRRGCLWGARAYLRGGDGPDARSRRNPAAQPLDLDAQAGRLRRSASVGGAPTGRGRSTGVWPQSHRQGRGCRPGLLGGSPSKASFATRARAPPSPRAVLTWAAGRFGGGDGIQPSPPARAAAPEARVLSLQREPAAAVGAGPGPGPPVRMARG